VDIPATSSNIPGTLVLRDSNGVASFGAGSVISGNTSTDALRITQEGSGNALVVEDSANPDSTPFVINSIGQIVSGSATAFNGLAGIQLTSNTSDAPNSNIQVRRCSNDTTASSFQMLKSRGSSSSLSAVQSGDQIGRIQFIGTTTALTNVSSAVIQCHVDGAPSSTQVPGRVAIFTSDGVDDTVERMRITSSGNVGIGTTAPDADAILDLSSTTKGFLPPRMTGTERDAIATPPVGLTVYNTTTNKLNFYNGTAWEAVTSA
jgi:hypothetical protein